jgi:hypothetical protein
VCESGINWAVIGAVLFGLAMFGVAYNAFIHFLGARKAGYTSLLVVGGVLVTLLGIALLDWRASVITLAGFVASGSPMIVGEVYRSITEREAALHRNWLEIEENARRILNNDDNAT